MGDKYQTPKSELKDRPRFLYPACPPEEDATYVNFRTQRACDAATSQLVRLIEHMKSRDLGIKED